MANTPKKFAIQQVFEILLRKPTTKQIIAYLEDAKTSGLENTVEMVYPTGGRGNVYIGGALAHSRRARLNVELATWNTEVMAVQNGTEIKTSNVDITEYEIIDFEGGTTATTKYLAKGATGAEIGYVYTVNDDGTFGKEYTQGTAATGDNFTYATGSKQIELPASANKIACAYVRTQATGAQLLEVEVGSIPEVVYATAYGLARDICSGDLYPCQVEGQAQVDGNYNFDLTADGDPAVQSLNLEFVKTCGSNKLYDLRVYTEEE